MRKGILIGILSATMLLGACATDPAKDETKAVTGEAAQVTPQDVAGTRYQIAPQNSKIEFVGSKVTGSHNGSFQQFSGEIDYAGSSENSRVNITIDIDSMTTDDDGLTKHLKTADFFDVANYPQATFVSTEIKQGGENGATHTVTGNLTMHGVTKAITFPATINVTPDAATVESNFSINRKDFGISYAGAANNLIRDDVVLKLNVRATK